MSRKSLNAKNSTCIIHYFHIINYSQIVYTVTDILQNSMLKLAPHLCPVIYLFQNTKYFSSGYLKSYCFHCIWTSHV